MLKKYSVFADTVYKSMKKCFYGTNEGKLLNG